MTDDKGRKYAARIMAPPDYVFEKVDELAVIAANDRQTPDQTGNEYISQILINDDRFFRVIYTAGGGLNVNGYDELNEASRRDREKPFEKKREPALMAAFLTGIKRGGIFTKPGRLDEFLRDGAKYLNGELPLFWPNQIIDQFIEETQPAPAVPTVRVSHKLEKSKNYIQQINEQMEIFFEETRTDISKYGLTESGLDLDETEEDVLFGIQTLYSDNNCKPNYIKDDLEAFRFTAPDLFRACGVPLRTYKGGRPEYDRMARNRIIKKLNSLSDKRRLFQFETPDPNNKKMLQGVEFVRPVWNLLKFYNKTANGKKKVIIGYALTDYKDTLSQDIVGYFLLLPRGLNQNIKQIVGRRYTKYHRRFFGYLFTQANDKRRFEEMENSPADWAIDINERLLIESRLKMTTYLKARQIDRIHSILNSCFTAAKELGYCKDIIAGTNKLGERKYTIILNRDKFMTLKNWGLKKTDELNGKTSINK